MILSATGSSEVWRGAPQGGEQRWGGGGGRREERGEERRGDGRGKEEYVAIEMLINMSSIRKFKVIVFSNCKYQQFKAGIG